MVDKSITGKIILLLNFIIVLVFGWVLGELGERKKQSRKQSCTVTEHVNNSLDKSPVFTVEWTRPHKLVLRADHVTVPLHFMATVSSTD
jgi:hypothetical protein